jgi:four helix bundle protein
MAKDNILQEKSFAFAVRTVNLYKFLREGKKEFILSKQILRSGTSIVADAGERCKILSKIVLTTKNKLFPKPLNS